MLTEAICYFICCIAFLGGVFLMVDARGWMRGFNEHIKLSEKYDVRLAAINKKHAARMYQEGVRMGLSLASQGRWSVPEYFDEEGNILRPERN